MEREPVATWSHLELGTFTFNGSWTTTVAASAFDVFEYNTGPKRHIGWPGLYTLSLEVENQDDTPSAAVLELAKRVLANAPALSQAVAASLWDDFNGHGPDSEMWWHGYLDDVNEGLEPPLQELNDIYAVMRLVHIVIRVAGTVGGGPLAELCFLAAFEIEHNVSVLTDGVSILGIGSNGDVLLFQPH